MTWACGMAQPGGRTFACSRAGRARVGDGGEAAEPAVGWWLVDLVINGQNDQIVQSLF
eukprot:SAG31_NODE_2569_length_5461_cov_6.801007_2_plen_58_part_00